MRPDHWPAPRLALPMALSVLVSLVVGCGGFDAAPAIRVISPEAGGALQIPWAPMTLDRLERQLGLGSGEMEGPAEVEALEGSSLSPVLSADRNRESRLAQVVDRLEPGEIERIVSEQATVASRLDALPVAAFSGVRAERFLSARNLSVQAADLLHRGLAEEALDRALAAAEAMEQLRPDRLAQEYIELAEAAFRRNLGPAAYRGETRDRALRLLEGARAALADGDDETALMRAYYACGVLGVEMA